MVIDYLIDNYISLVLGIGLVLAILGNTNINKKTNRAMLLLVIIVLLLSVDWYLNDYFKLIPECASERLVTSIVSYIISPIPIAIVITTTNQAKKLNRIVLLILIINALVYISALFCDVAFSVTDDNLFVRGPLGFVNIIVCILLLVIAFIEVIKMFRSGNRSASAMLIMVPISIIGAMALNVASIDESLLLPVVLIGALFFYLYMSTVIEAEHNEMKEQIMKKQRNTLTLSQLQPHFLYNTLSTIRYLCTTDPKLADKTIKSFSDYLRTNLLSVEQEDTVPITDEIEHVRKYMEIEQLRFDNISIEYDLEDNDIYLPILSIQPLVENSVKHGLRNKKDGLIKITTRRIDDNHVITIADNGSGFDVNAEHAVPEEHVGIRVVSDRISTMTGGELQVKSVIGEGTIITIKIPF